VLPVLPVAPLPPLLDDSATANTVPVNCPTVGVEPDVPSVAVRPGTPFAHAGGPTVSWVGDTVSHELPFHHSRLVPPFRVQSVIVRLEKLLPVATLTSKYSPAEVNEGVPAGFDA
jgi:hypothetical protein